MATVTRTKLLLPRQSISSAVEDPANSPSLSQLVSTLVPALAFAGVFLLVFLLLRTRITRAYSPRSHLTSIRSHERTPELPRGLFNWFKAFAKLSDDHVLTHSSLDGFLLLRYLKISTVICLVGTLVTWPILLPVNATGGGRQEQLNKVSFSNVMKNNRYYAHALLAWVFFGFVFFMVTRELLYYIHLRQAYLISPSYANRVSAKTVLFMNVPEEYRDEAHLRIMFGSCKHIWLVTDCSELAVLVKKRDKIAIKLEKAETRLIKMANKGRLKEEKKAKKGKTEAEPADTTQTEVAVTGEDAISRWVPAKKRPTHRLKFLFGQKVDTIDWCKSELKTLIPEVEAMQQSYRAGEKKKLGAVFIEFNSQREAQAAYSTLAHHQALHMAPRFIGLSPEEVIWSNLHINWAFRVVRNMVTGGAVFALLIFWAIPVAFVGALSNIQALTKGDPTTGKGPLLPWLGFINDIPEEILGVVQGLLPSALLALLMALLPPFLRFMARLTGKPSKPAVEMRLQTYYFVFQVIQVFLVTTISSGAAAAVIQIINQPNKVTSLLAEDLPKASNFYVSYFILQGLGVASEALAQVFDIAIFTILSRLLDRTPRQMYKRFTELSGLGWGTEFPVYTLFTVIAITYSMIAPIVLGFATVGLFLIYLAYRYNLLFVFNADVDCQGLPYARALKQTLTGCYLGILCMIGLFAVKHTPGPLILMFILLIVCFLYHVNLNRSIAPLLEHLPRSLEVEEESLVALADGGSEHSNVEKGELTIVQLRSRQMSDLADQQQSNFLQRFLFPHKHHNFHYFRKLVGRKIVFEYNEEDEQNAYYNPAITAPRPILWIPRDPMGVSTVECNRAQEIGLEMKDDGADFDKKGRITWDQSNESPPIYEEKVYY